MTARCLWSAYVVDTPRKINGIDQTSEADAISYAFASERGWNRLLRFE